MCQTARDLFAMASEALGKSKGPTTVYFPGDADGNWSFPAAVEPKTAAASEYIRGAFEGFRATVPAPPRRKRRRTLRANEASAAEAEKRTDSLARAAETETRKITAAVSSVCRKQYVCSYILICSFCTSL